MNDDEACLNTDRELWREREDDAYADSIHVTKQGSIGINCGGHVITMPLRDWHALAKRYTGTVNPSFLSPSISIPPCPKFEIKQPCTCNYCLIRNPYFLTGAVKS